MLPADACLHVVCPLFNPRRFESHVLNQQAFIMQMLASPNVQLTTIELAFAGREPRLESMGERHNHVVVRGSSEIWVKENLLNLAVRALPNDWQYVAWIDGDVQFLRPDWALQTMHALQHYSVVQPWSDCLDLGPQREVIQHHRSFLHQYCTGQPMKAVAYDGITFPHPGYAWACTRQAWDTFGGLLETAVLGSADHHQALCLLGRGAESIPGGVSEGYRRAVMAWQARAARLHRNLGFVEGTIVHAWHGSKASRKYIERWGILVKNAFDPDHDLRRNSMGVLELDPERVQLRDDIRGYFAQRQDDLNVHLG
jgi:hypothetical protein